MNVKSNSLHLKRLEEKGIVIEEYINTLKIIKFL
mgnify:CR=1 FL=1